MGATAYASEGNPGDEASSEGEKAETDASLASREFHTMVRYALAEGLSIDDNTRRLIAQVEAESAPPDLDLLIAAHGSLLKIIAPATPRSLEATEPASGWLGSFRRPPLILTMMIVALLAAIGFVATAVESVEQGGSVTPAGTTSNVAANNAFAFGRRPLHLARIALGASSTTGTSAPHHPSVQSELNWVFAAALGAAFYVLFTAHTYVAARTFDPRYNSVYTIRCVLGILSGLILANVAAAPLFDSNQTFRNLGPAVIALLGGFSAEAVYQILQRLVDVLLAAVRGDNSAEAKNKASQTAQNELLSLASDSTVAANPALLDKIHGAIKKVGQ
jgi:hypothetical protein